MTYEAQAACNIDTWRFTCVDHLTDPDSLHSLTQNHLRTMKTEMFPSFLLANVYLQGATKRVELNIWRTSSGLASERSCTSSSSNAWSASPLEQNCVSDWHIVLIKDKNLSRSSWQLARASCVVYRTLQTQNNPSQQRNTHLIAGYLLKLYLTFTKHLISFDTVATGRTNLQLT